MTQVYISIGSNINAEENLRKAEEKLKAWMTRLPSLYLIREAEEKLKKR